MTGWQACLGLMLNAHAALGDVEPGTGMKWKWKCAGNGEQLACMDGPPSLLHMQSTPDTGRCTAEGCALHPAPALHPNTHPQVVEKLLLAGYQVDMLGGPEGPVDIEQHAPTGAAAAPAATAAAAAAAAASATGDVATGASTASAGRLKSTSGQQRSGIAGGSVSGGHTALHLAASRGYCAALAVLLQHGASVWKQDWRGCTALQRAAEGGHRGAFELLLIVSVCAWGRGEGFHLSHACWRPVQRRSGPTEE